MFDFQGLVQRGLGQMEQRQFADAEKTWRTLLSTNPRDDQLLHLLGVALVEQGRDEEALEPLKRAISLQRRRPDYHNALGCALRNTGDFAPSLESFQRALKLDPALDDTHYNLALTFIKLGRFAEGEARLRHLLANGPPDPEMYRALCDLHWLLGEHEQAIAALRAGIDAIPDSGNLRFSLGDGLLALGQFEEGWFCYLWRVNRHLFLQRTGQAFNDPRLLAPYPASMEGRTVLVHGEQGLGDDLFFLRFAAQLRQRGARVEGLVIKRLTGMVGRSGALDACAPAAERIPPGPEYRMLADLPFLLESHRGPVPGSLRFEPLPDNVRDVAARLKDLPRPLIGLTWRAGTAPEIGSSRALFKSVPFEDFATMAAMLPGTLLVMQREPKVEELARLRELCGPRIADLSDLNPDLEALLALLVQLDDYVCVSNTNVHLLAALGRTARVLVTRTMEFRWMAEGADSPWFPGFPVYRQAKGGAWDAALEAVRIDVCGGFEGNSSI